jgi:hypothetical protein
VQIRTNHWGSLLDWWRLWMKSKRRLMVWRTCSDTFPWCWFFAVTFRSGGLLVFSRYLTQTGSCVGRLHVFWLWVVFGQASGSLFCKVHAACREWTGSCLMCPVWRICRSPWWLDRFGEDSLFSGLFI